MAPGEIYRLDRFYLSRDTGAYEPKYVLVLAIAAGGDIVGRLLTSRAHGRPEHPQCFHGDPYPGYYLGVLGGPLTAKTWLDLRRLDDLDAIELQRTTRYGQVTHTMTISNAILAGALDCAAGAEDTTTVQAKFMRDVLATLR